jgi:hypothetical protein
MVVIYYNKSINRYTAWLLADKAVYLLDGQTDMSK